MKINPYIQKTSYALASLGFGILTVERFLKVAELANEVFKCHESQNRCQSLFIQSIKDMATCIATIKLSYDLGMKAMENQPFATPDKLKRLSPMVLRSSKSDDVVQHVSPRPEIGELIGPPKGASQ